MLEVVLTGPIENMHLSFQLRYPAAMKRFLVFSVAAVLAMGCGGGDKPANNATAPSGAPTCKKDDKVQQYDLHDPDGQDHFVPCAETGKEDFAGNIHFDTVADGIMVTIDATDDDFNEGKIGTEVKGRDAVIVYPSGAGTAGVEIPLKKTANGYSGKQLIPFDKLNKLTDEGTKIEVAIHDDDDSNKNGKSHEELKVSIAISAGKSCEKAIDENPQSITMGGKQTADLTAAQLGAPMQNSAFMSSCGLPDSSNAEICAAVKGGKPLGVSVTVKPANNKVATCIDRSVRKLSFPKSDKLDVVKQSF